MLSSLVILLGLACNQHVSAAGFYLQELGTPSSIGTAGTARTTNNFGAKTAFGNPAGMTGLKKDVLHIGSQLVIPSIRFDSDIATSSGISIP